MQPRYHSLTPKAPRGRSSSGSAPSRPARSPSRRSPAPFDAARPVAFMAGAPLVGTTFIAAEAAARIGRGGARFGRDALLGGALRTGGVRGALVFGRDVGGSRRAGARSLPRFAGIGRAQQFRAPLRSSHWPGTAWAPGRSVGSAHGCGPVLARRPKTAAGWAAGRRREESVPRTAAVLSCRLAQRRDDGEPLGGGLGRGPERVGAHCQHGSEPPSS